MSQPRISVIVVSHGRPDLLCRAALSVFHQNHRPVELITNGPSCRSCLGQPDCNFARYGAGEIA
ncbi:hypothetical protein FZCC0069_01175 [Rhodobacterales bacterium FZCC0069]|nr:hypothetical protein [Rhodobacterales bacterium FZCC0069]